MAWHGMGAASHLIRERTAPTACLHACSFWAEIYDGAKLFYLSGLQHGRYLKREVSQQVLKEAAVL